MGSFTDERSGRAGTTPLGEIAKSTLKSAFRTGLGLEQGSPEALPVHPNPRPIVSRPIRKRTLEMCEMRTAGMTFREIAVRYGVTYQAVQQAVSGAVGRNPEVAARLSKAHGMPAKPPRPLRFKARMLHWLRWAGFRYCWCCKIVHQDLEFSPKGRLCRTCNAMKARELYSRSSVVRETIRRHNRIHGKKYNQRYIEKLKRENPERLREIRRHAYQNRKAKSLEIAASAA